MAPATAAVRELAETLIISIVSLHKVGDIGFFATSLLHNAEVPVSHPAKLDDWHNASV
jgi:hypothetical protein